PWETGQVATLASVRARSDDRRPLSLVHILESHDVVFTQVAARLYLDQLQWNLAGVLQSVLAAQGDICALVLTQHENPVITGNAGSAAHYDPVLGAVVMHLQAEGGAGVDDDALDLETL